MDPPAPRPRSFDLPKPGAEAGLAEWTSRIKALQRQVDEDEEAEQRKLEEEIAASRLARQRRSAMYQGPRAEGGTGRAESLTKTEEPRDRQKHLDDALHRLTAPSGSATAASPPPSTGPSRPAPSHPISLAQFMGGRLAAPPLRRHAPQADAHDPTQFAQRSLADFKAPHPIFGSRGVAMPGLAGKAPSSPPASHDDTAARTEAASPHGAPRAEAASQRERRVSTPPVARRYVERLEVQALAPQRTGGRERTVSTPTGGAPLRRVTSPRFEPEPVKEPPRHPISHSPAPGRRSTTPSNGRITPSAPLKSPTSPTPSNAYSTPSRPFTPAQSTPSVTSSPSTPSKTPITTPSLARPKQPEPPKPSVFGPQIVPSPKPSPAFLRPPPEKQPTPSLSRLKGRGFVQSMVKVSSELSQQATGSPTPAGGKGAGGKRLSNVLDRWPASPSPSSPPPPPPASAPMRKSFTADPASSRDREPQASKLAAAGRSLKSAPSLPNMASKAAGGDGPGLGSSNTLISYIKPMKTGESAPPSRPATAPPHEVDELGMRVSSHRTGGSGVSGISSGLPPSSGKPLSHPTKDRVKLRRKGKDGKPSKNEAAVPAAIPEESATNAQRAAEAPPIQVAPEPPQRLEPPTSNASRALTPPSPRAVSPNEEAKERSLSSTSSREGSTGRVTDRWTNGAVIGVKPLAPAGRISPQPPTSPQPKGMVGRQALPGLATVPTPAPAAKDEKSPAPGRPKHARIPSTGNRATVMDVAQVFNEVHSRESSVSPAPMSPSPQDAPEPEKLPELEAKPAPLPRVSRPLPAPPLQSRKPSYDRYSVINLPPLEEEKTPAPSPAGTLAKKTAAPPSDQEPSPTLVAEELKEIEKDQKANAENPVEVEIKVDEPQPEVEKVTEEAALEVVHLNFVEDSLPSVDVQAVLKKRAPSFKPNPNDTTVSVDVMTIMGNTATAVGKDSHIFYDTEVLAIIHRSKSKTSGLVSNKVWGWCGKNSRLEEREERKLQELAKRYGTTLERVRQYSEPAELVHVLGGRLAIRQGTREHWSAENTCMHLVRRHHGHIFIDEHDLSIRNLCSGFSYCLSVLGTVYVWHGCGSLPLERQAALDYARGLAADPGSVVELVEGESDEDEMFWMVLGDREEYARADHWRWRAAAAKTDPRVWRVDGGDGKDSVRLVASFTDEAAISNSVYIVDCIWEFFVLVGSDARGKRGSIKLAVSTATEMSSRTAAAKPFTPAVHIVVLPSQLPLDLRLSFRDLDEEALNHGDVPSHMHLLTVAEAQEQLEKSVWEKTKLQDHSLLPLGVDVSMLS